jgi:hypothetical protein
MKIFATFLLFCSLPLFSQSTPSPETLLHHADTLYWFGMSESGDMQSFREGLRLVEEAENQLKADDAENRDQLLRRAQGLRSDLTEQSIIAGDTLNGSMPLQRILLFKAPQLEIFDEPDVMATTRAAEGLVSTIQSHWMTVPQLDVVYNSSITHQEDGSPILADRTPARSPAMENEASYLFNLHPRFFNHNAKEILDTLNQGQAMDFYRNGLSAQTADILTQAFGISRLLEVHIEELDLYQNIRFHVAQARLFRQGEGLRDDRLFVFGFTRDARAILPWLALTILVIWIAGIGCILSLHQQQTFSSRTHAILLSSTAFVLGTCIAILGQHLLQRLYPGPEALLKTSLWFSLLQLISLLIVPALFAVILRLQIRKYCGWDIYTILPRSLYQSSVAWGALPLCAYTSLTYLGLRPGLLLLLCAAPAILISWGILFSEKSHHPLSKITGLSLMAFAALVYLRIPEIYIDGVVQTSLLLITALGGVLFLVRGKRVSGVLCQPLLASTLLLLSGCAWMAASPFLALSVTLPAMLIQIAHLTRRRGSVVRPETKTKILQTLSIPKAVSIEDICARPYTLPYYKTEKVNQWLTATENHFPKTGSLIHYYSAAGSGKTRFCQEVSNGLLPRTFLVLSGQGNPHEPLGALKSAFSSVGFQIPDQQWAEMIEKTGSHLLSIVPMVDTLLSLIDVEEQTKTNAPPLYADLCTFLRTLQQKARLPVVLVFDDADKLDTASIAWLQDVQKDLNCRPYPLHLILLSTTNTSILDGVRPEKSPFDFSPEDLQTYLTQYLGIEKELCDTLRADLQRIPEFCTPFYCIEWLDILYREKFIDQKASGIFRRPEKNTEHLPTPGSLTQAVQHRLQQVSPETRVILLAAAVDGEKFDVHLLSQVVNQNVLTIETALDHAEQCGIIRDILSEDGCYAFVSPLYRSHILELYSKPASNGSMNASQKILDLHKRYSDAYHETSSSPDDALIRENDAFKAATHALKAGSKYIPQALERAQVAADIGLRQGDYHSARNWGQQAINHAGGQMLPETHAELLLRVLEAEAVLHPQDTACRSALRLLSSPKLPSQLKGDLQIASSEILQRGTLQDLQEAQSLIADYLDSKPQDTDAKWIQAQGLRLVIQRKRCTHFKDPHLTADQLATDYKETLEKLPDPQSMDVASQRMIARIYNDFGEFYSNAQQPQAAIDWFEKSLHLKKEIGDRAGMAISNGCLGRCILYSWKEEWTFFSQHADRARESFEQDEALSIELGDFRGQLMMPSHLGHLALLQNQGTEAEVAYQRALTLARAQNDTYSQAFALQGLLLAHKLNHNPVDAQQVRDQLQQLDPVVKANLKSDLLEKLTPDLGLEPEDLKFETENVWVHKR